MLATISAALLTGGASSRMGRDKAHLEIDGSRSRPASRACWQLSSRRS